MMEIIWRLYSKHARYIMTIVKKTRIVEPMPDLIIVNNEYYFSRAGVLGYKIHTGETIPYGEYTMIQKKSDPNVGAMGLFQLISRIMTVSTLLPYMEIDLNEYNKKIDETLLTLHNNLPMNSYISKSHNLGCDLI